MSTQPFNPVTEKKPTTDITSAFGTLLKNWGATEQERDVAGMFGMARGVVTAAVTEKSFTANMEANANVTNAITSLKAINQQTLNEPIIATNGPALGATRGR